MMLYIIPSFLSDNVKTLSPEASEIAKNIDEFVVEDEKSARRFLKLIGTNYRQEDLKFHLLNEHSKPEEKASLRKLFSEQKNIGLLSEAGCPAVADPGAEFIAMAHDAGVRVIPLTGPSSILLALMASGLNGQSFVFHGYLPRESTQRKNKLVQLSNDTIKRKQTQIFIEAPYRNNQLFADIIASCDTNIRLCVACDLTSADESINTKQISAWENQIPELNKRPAIFLLGL